MPEGPATLDTPGTAECDDILADWLRSASERFEWFRHVASSAEVRTATKQFAKPSGIGRARGRLALERAFAPVAHLESRGDSGKLPFLIWSLIRPRPELAVVSVNFAATIRFEDGRASIVSMSWTIDATEDALAGAVIEPGVSRPDPRSDPSPQCREVRANPLAYQPLNRAAGRQIPQRRIAHRHFGVRIVLRIAIEIVVEIALRVGFLAESRADFRRICVLDLRRHVFFDVGRGAVAEPECAVGRGLRGLTGSGFDGGLRKWQRNQCGSPAMGAAPPPGGFNRFPYSGQRMDGPLKLISCARRARWANPLTNRGWSIRHGDGRTDDREGG